MESREGEPGALAPRVERAAIVRRRRRPARVAIELAGLRPAARPVGTSWLIFALVAVLAVGCYAILENARKTAAEREVFEDFRDALHDAREARRGSRR